MTNNEAVCDQKDLGSTLAQIKHFYAQNFNLYEDIGTHFKSPPSYLHEFMLRYPEVDIQFLNNPKGLNFVTNKTEPVHRWTSYIEGFSKDFVYDIFEQFSLDANTVVLDPFAGSGTVLVCAKMRGIPSIGVEINPTVYRILETKTKWNGSPEKIEQVVSRFNFPQIPISEPPVFLSSSNQFQPEILTNLLRLKDNVWSVADPKVRPYVELAFLTTLLPSSNFKRSPSICYDKSKTDKLYPSLPFDLFFDKIGQLVADLRELQAHHLRPTPCEVFNKDAKEFLPPASNGVDAVITSPPYLNSFDYVGNYKLEIGWMEDATSTKELQILRDQMVLCDNVSRKMIKDYGDQPAVVELDWLQYITQAIQPRMRERVGIRRTDYPLLVRKYFEDIYKVLTNIYKVMNKGGRVAWVVGDSLLTDVYVPTDLLTMMMAEQIGFELDKVEVDRVRRSGIRRSFVLRESVLYFSKQ